MHIILKKSFGGQKVTVDLKSIKDKVVLRVGDSVLSQPDDYEVEDPGNKDIIEITMANIGGPPIVLSNE